jgi:hydroxymethylbilane synthase
LAQWQAEWVAGQLRQRGIAVELMPIATAGDRRREALDAIGGQGLFTKEIQLALVDGRIDLAVHSLKDLPTAETPGLCLAAVPERGPVGDVLISAGGRSLDALPGGARIGTGSPRRRAQLLRDRSDLQMKDIRGNVDTRLRKLREGQYDAIVLAEAGLMRLGLAGEITQRLPLEIVLPAVGQGALGLETRTDDASTRQWVAQLDHPPTHAAVAAERALMARLQGGCTAPVAALGRADGDQLTLIGRVVGLDGAKLLEARKTASSNESQSLGRHVAELLLGQGAGAIVMYSSRSA